MRSLFYRFRIVLLHNKGLKPLVQAMLIAVLILGAVPIVHAQGSKITYGQTAKGRITNEIFRVVYSFDGRQGDVVDITLSKTEGSLDPVLILTDDQSNLIASDDDSAPAYDAAILSQQLTHDGTYFVIVTRFGQERGLTTGGFALTLSHVGATNSGAGTALQYGDSVVGELSGEQFQQVYVFRANRGDIIQITMQRISGNVDSLLILADSQGNVLTVNDEDAESPGSYDAAIRDFRITKTGNYMLIATRFGREAGESRGGFSLALDRLPPESLGKVPQKAVLIDYGSKSTGSISSDNLLQFYLIEARKGDVLTISAERTKGNLDPILTLYTEDLKELATNDSGQRGQSARISAFAVPADGFYILLVTRFNRDTGITAGDYTLTLTGRTSVTVGADGKATLAYNTVATAIIDDGNVAQQYTFSGTAGDVVTITMDVVSGNLIGQLLLIDPNKKQVALDDPGAGDAKLVRLRLQSTGDYTIIATRRGREKGTSRGTYRLMLSQENATR